MGDSSSTKSTLFCTYQLIDLFLPALNPETLFRETIRFELCWAFRTIRCAKASWGHRLAGSSCFGRKLLLREGEFLEVCVNEFVSGIMRITAEGEISGGGVNEFRNGAGATLFPVEHEREFGAFFLCND